MSRPGHGGPVTLGGRPALAWHAEPPVEHGVAAARTVLAVPDDDAVAEPVGDAPARATTPRARADAVTGDWDDLWADRSPGALAGTGWLPRRPGDDPEPDDGPESDGGARLGQDVPTDAALGAVDAAAASRAPDDREHRTTVDLRRRAARRVADAYAATHGHPTTHSGFDPPGESSVRRWATAPRVAVAALVVVLGLGAVCTATALASGDDAVRAVGTVAAGTSGADGTGVADEMAEVPAVDASGQSGAEPVAEDSESPTGTEPQDAATVVVHVVGQVSSPGLVTVDAGARVADAITAAGGATPDADLAALNLARTVTDGEQIVVPRPGEAVAAAPQPEGGTAPGGEAGQVVDLNTADAATLDGLPGIGPVLAERIVTWRADNGPFTSVDELGEVSGIGPAVLADVRDLVRV